MNWLKQLMTRNALKRDLAEEMRQHLGEKIEALIAEGLNRSEAEHRARREFGNVTLLEERSREIWDWTAVEFLMADAYYAVRRLVQTPGFTIVCLLTLALGIGVNTGIFTLLNAVLLKSLPVPAPDQLFLVKQSGRTAEKTRFSYPLYQRVSRQIPDAISIAAMGWPDLFFVGSGSGPDETATGQLVSSGFFETFETQPLLGRLFDQDEDDRAGGHSEAVVSYEYWQRHLAADTAVMGRTLLVNHVPFVIIGITKPGFFGARPEAQPDFWLPLAAQFDVHYHSHYSDTTDADPSKPWLAQEDINWLQFVVRVKDSAAVPRFTAVMNRLFHDELQNLIRNGDDPQRQRRLQDAYLTLEPGQKGFATLREQFRNPLFLLFALTFIILLIACANVANLLLARASARERANAIQISIGAGRWRLLRQILIESLLLSFGGGLCGIGVAFWCAHVIPKWVWTPDRVLPLNLAPDWRILLFGIAMAVLTGTLFGLAPAIECLRVDPVVALKTNAKTTHGRTSGRRWSLRNSLVMGQVALSLLLLAAAGMFWRTLTNYSQLDPGFDRDHLLSVRVDTHLITYNPADFLSLYRRLVDGLNALPGVRSSSVASCALVVGCLDASDVFLFDKSSGTADRVNAQMQAVSLGYFHTVGVHLLRGRLFRTTDKDTSPRVALVNQTFANRFSNRRDVLGRRFAYDLDSTQRFEIVGLVSDARVNDVRQVAPPLIYFSIEQAPGNIGSIDILTAANPKSLVSEARQIVRKVDPRLSILRVNTLSDQVLQNLTIPRVIALLAGMFGILALGLACLGLYGVMSYLVGQRTAEIGIRLALGSNRSLVLWLVLKESLLLAAIGVAAGLALSLAVMQFATSFLYGLSADDPPTMTAAGLLLLFVSIMAGVLPAWKAATVNPMDALRAE